jgi:hypothetical protein
MPASPLRRGRRAMAKAPGGTEWQQIALKRDRLIWVLLGSPKREDPGLYRWLRRRPALLYHWLDKVAGGPDETAAAALFARLILTFGGEEQEIIAIAHTLDAEQRVRGRRFAQLLLPLTPPRKPRRIGGDYCTGGRLLLIIRPRWNATHWGTRWLLVQ